MRTTGVGYATAAVMLLVIRVKTRSSRRFVTHENSLAAGTLSHPAVRPNQNDVSTPFYIKR